jgi:hypothetical protein
MVISFWDKKFEHPLRVTKIEAQTSLYLPSSPCRTVSELSTGSRSLRI